MKPRYVHKQMIPDVCSVLFGVLFVVFGYHLALRVCYLSIRSLVNIDRRLKRFFFATRGFVAGISARAARTSGAADDINCTCWAARLQRRCVCAPEDCRRVKPSSASCIPITWPAWGEAPAWRSPNVSFSSGIGAGTVAPSTTTPSLDQSSTEVYARLHALTTICGSCNN